MKKVIVLFIIVLLAAPVFAQQSWEGNRRFTVNLSSMPMFVGMVLGGFGIEGAAEFAPIRPFSMRGSFRYIGYDPINNLDKFSGISIEKDSGIKFSTLRLTFEGRWYPSHKYVQGFFLDGGFQFDRISGKLEFKKITLGGGLNIFGLFGGFGYKWVFGVSRVAFSIEPAFNFVWPLKSDIPFNDFGLWSSNYLGWIFGVRMVRGGLRFGVTF